MIEQAESTSRPARGRLKRGLRTGRGPSPRRERARGHRARNRSRTAGSAPATSTIFFRLAAPATSVTARRRTPNASAIAASAAAVACPSTARVVTRTTRAPSRSPPTQGRADPGRTQTVTLTCPVCAHSGGQSAAEFFRGAAEFFRVLPRRCARTHPDRPASPARDIRPGTAKLTGRDGGMDVSSAPAPGAATIRAESHDRSAPSRPAAARECD